jgi:hypothetical protein
MGKSFFEWDEGNPYRIVDYMRLLGFNNLRVISPDQRRALSPAFDRMAPWPAESSVLNVDDVFLVNSTKSPAFGGRTNEATSSLLGSQRRRF